MSAAPSQSISEKTRSIVRHAALNALSITRPNKSKKWIRPLYGHSVFDDQVEAFRAHIKICLNKGEFISTDELYDILTNELPIDGNYFHFSFDDGYKNVLTNAARILNEYDIPSIMFVNPESINSSFEYSYKFCKDTLHQYKAIEFCTWEDLKNAESLKVDIGSHSYSHKKLSHISKNPQNLKFQIHNSKKTLEEKLEKPVKYFAWPYGREGDIDEDSLSEIKNAGYLMCFSAIRGTISDENQHDLFYLPRHQLEPQFPNRHVKYFIKGGAERL